MEKAPEESPERHRDAPDLDRVWRWLLASSLVGVACGLVAVLYYYLLELSTEFFAHFLAGFYPPLPAGEIGAGGTPQTTGSPVWWEMILVPGLGGIIAGLLFYFFSRDAQRSGTDLMIESYNKKQGSMIWRIPVIKSLAAVFVIGSGGSVGREGPIVQLGAFVGQSFHRFFKALGIDRRTLLLAGAAGGFGSIFRAPLSGAVFSTEVLYRNPDFEYEAFVPSLISSIFAYTTFGVFFGYQPIFQVGTYVMENPLELLLFAFFGVACAATGIGYVKTLRVSRELFDKIPLPPIVVPALGGVLLGMVLLFVPEVWGTGYGWLQQAMDGELEAFGLSAAKIFPVFLGLGLAKIVATSVTYGSRGGEGVFGPTFFVGGMVGAAFGTVAHSWFPEIVHENGVWVYMLLGMGGVFAGVTKVPIAGLIMVMELSGSYSLLLPMILVSSITYVLTGKFSVYKSQVPTRADSPVHASKYIRDILEGAVVSDVWKPGGKVETVPRDMPLSQLLKRVPHSRYHHFPVVDMEERMVGIISLHDIRSVLYESQAGTLLIAEDLATTDVISVTASESLNEALRKFALLDVELLPVVDEESHDKVLGFLTRQEVIALYNERLRKHLARP